MSQSSVKFKDKCDISALNFLNVSNKVKNREKNVAVIARTVEESE